MIAKPAPLRGLCGKHPIEDFDDSCVTSSGINFRDDIRRIRDPHYNRNVENDSFGIASCSGRCKTTNLLAIINSKNVDVMSWTTPAAA